MCSILLVTGSSEATTPLLRHATGDAIATLQEFSRHCSIRERHLYPGVLSPISADTIDALATEPSRRSPDQCRAAALSEILLKEVRLADVLILEAPLMDGRLPDELILWSNHVSGAAHTQGDGSRLTKIALLVADTNGGLELDGNDLAAALQKHLAPAGISEVALVEPDRNGYPLRSAPLMVIASRSPTPLH